MDKHPERIGIPFNTFPVSVSSGLNVVDKSLYIIPMSFNFLWDNSHNHEKRKYEREYDAQSKGNVYL